MKEALATLLPLFRIASGAHRGGYLRNLRAFEGYRPCLGTTVRGTHLSRCANSRRRRRQRRRRPSSPARRGTTVTPGSEARWVVTSERCTRLLVAIAVDAGDAPTLASLARRLWYVAVCVRGWGGQRVCDAFLC